MSFKKKTFVNTGLTHEPRHCLPFSSHALISRYESYVVLMCFSFISENSDHFTSYHNSIENIKVSYLEHVYQNCDLFLALHPHLPYAKPIPNRQKYLSIYNSTIL